MPTNSIFIFTSLAKVYGLNHKTQFHFELSVACAVISAVAVITRIYCKLRHKQDVRSDDYWNVIGLAFYGVSVAIVACGMIDQCQRWEEPG